MLLFVESDDAPGGIYSGVVFPVVSIKQLLFLFLSMHSPLSEPSSPPLALMDSYTCARLSYSENILFC